MTALWFQTVTMLLFMAVVIVHLLRKVIAFDWPVFVLLVIVVWIILGFLIDVGRSTRKPA